jgi:hypothetical protein
MLRIKQGPRPLQQVNTATRSAHHASTPSARPEGPPNSFSLWFTDTTANLGSQNYFAPIKTNH